MSTHNLAKSAFTFKPFIIFLVLIAYTTSAVGELAVTNPNAVTTPAAGGVHSAAQGNQHRQNMEEAQSKGDQGTSNKEMMMMMMQMAQAAAMMAAAMANKKTKEKAKEADPVQTPPAIPGMAEPAKPQESPVALPAASSAPSPEKEEAEVAPAAVAEAAAPAFVAPEVPPSVSEELPPKGGGPGGIASTVPKAIEFDRTKLGYDESSKTSGSDGNAGAAATFAGGVGAGAKAATGDLTGKAKEAGDGKHQERFAKNSTQPEGEGASGESAGATPATTGSAEGGGDMMAMLSEMMGGGKGAVAGASGQHGDPIDSNLSPTNGKSAGGEGRENIFQHASYRYQKLAFEEGDVKKKGFRGKVANVQETAAVLAQAKDTFSATVVGTKP